MTTRTLLTLGASALLLGGTMVGCATHSGGLASASSLRGDAAEQAAELAGKAQKALARQKLGDAVDYAEAAVTLQPRTASFRSLLGNAYLQAGRFTSARQAFADALLLDSNDGRAALNLALAQTGEGDWGSARKTLDDHAGVIPASDRGLALALAGDPNSAVEVLVAAARSPGADAKTRQNLALAFALAGNWQAARSIAMVDLAPAEVDKRIEQWAAFATPHAASDQVAALLGVRATKDQGQPIALALNADSAPVGLAAADPIDAYMPGPAEAADAPALAIAADVPVAGPVPAPAPRATAAVVFAPAREVVQQLPARSAPAPRQLAARSVPRAQQMVRPSAALAKGNWYVQLGAFDNAAVARDAWMRAKRRYAGIADETPSGMAISSERGSFYRLSVGGYARADAVSLCRQIKAKGGRCFVRADAGDQTAQWLRKGEQLASR